MTHEADLVLVGGGLANGLIAYRLKLLRPELRIRVIERETRLGGNHTWSFHHSDLTPEEHDWVRPLVSRSWGRYSVHFPRYSREIEGGYHSILSERFHDVISAAVGGDLVLAAEARKVSAGEVELADGA